MSIDNRINLRTIKFKSMLVLTSCKTLNKKKLIAGDPEDNEVTCDINNSEAQYSEVPQCHSKFRVSVVIVFLY